MIRHIVLFKLKDFGSDPDRENACREVLNHLDELPLKIDLILSYKAGMDIRKLNWSYDIVLEMDFNSMADLDAYTTHPAHQEFVTFNKDYSVAKTCVDFEV